MRSDGDERARGVVPEPKASVPHDALPHALTFYLTAGQRRAVLAVVRKYHRTRATGLLRALGVEQETKE